MNDVLDNKRKRRREKSILPLNYQIIILQNSEEKTENIKKV